MKRVIRAASDRRADLISAIEKIRSDANDDLSNKMEIILQEEGASEDDSDPAEGFYVTMSDEDLERAYERIQEFLPQSFTYRFYFKDGNQKLIEAENIYEALSFVCFDLTGIKASDIYKIEEVK